MTQYTEFLPEYIGYDLGGFHYNKEFPPDERRFGTHHGGYPSDTAQVFFYDYLVQLYGVVFSYNGKNYVIPESDNETLVNLTENTKTVFDSPFDLVKMATIDGIPLLTLIAEDRLKNVDIQ